jgi:hypothetical protein
MKEVVFNYLDKHYRFTLSTYSSYMLQDKQTKEDVYLRSVFAELETIFSVTPEELEVIWGYWADAKILELNNKITDIRYKVYEITGKTVELGINEINNALIVDEEDVKLFLGLGGE